MAELGEITVRLEQLAFARSQQDPRIKLFLERMEMHFQLIHKGRLPDLDHVAGVIRKFDADLSKSRPLESVVATFQRTLEKEQSRRARLKEEADERHRLELIESVNRAVGTTFPQHLLHKWKDRACPVCHANHWRVPKVAYELREFEGGYLATAVFEKGLFVVVPVICEGCGYTLLFSAPRSTVSDSQPEWTDLPK